MAHKLIVSFIKSISVLPIALNSRCKRSLMIKGVTLCCFHINWVTHMQFLECSALSLIAHAPTIDKFYVIMSLHHL